VSGVHLPDLQAGSTIQVSATEINKANLNKLYICSGTTRCKPIFKHNKLSLNLSGIILNYLLKMSYRARENRPKVPVSQRMIFSWSGGSVEMALEKWPKKKDNWAIRVLTTHGLVARSGGSKHKISISFHNIFSKWFTVYHFLIIPLWKSQKGGGQIPKDFNGAISYASDAPAAVNFATL